MAKAPPHETALKSLIYNILRKSKWLMIFLVAIYHAPRLSAQTCPTFSVGMEGPVYDDVEHYFAIEVFIQSFGNIPCAGINLSIDYTNASNITIAEELTEGSALPGLEEINANFDFTSGRVELGGISVPLYDGPVLTTEGKAVLFTIFFYATPGECSDFTFDEKAFIVSFPGIPDWASCDADVVSEATGSCIEGFTLSGNIENPWLDCEDGIDGGIPYVDVLITELNDQERYDCATDTDIYGDFECTVTGGLDYRVSPVNEFNRNCGLSSLDIDLFRDHLLANNCLDDVWQLLSGDVDGNGTLSTLDLVEIQKALQEDRVSWPSWTFVPTSDYIEMELPDCPASGQNTLPSYDPYIDVLEVDDDIPGLDFVGIKMGDADASCEQCSEELMSGPEVHRRTPPIQVNLKEVNNGLFELAFDRDIEGLRILFLAIECKEEPVLIDHNFLNHLNLVTSYRNGVYHLSYVSLEPKGELFRQGDRIFRLAGQLRDATSGGLQIQNELISKAYYSPLKVNSFEVKEPIVYPNPSDVVIHVSLPEMEYASSTTFLIYDALGREAMNAILPCPGIPMYHGLPRGMYSYQIKSYTGTWGGKLIIQ